MAKQFPNIPKNLMDFIKNQKIFFVGTAAAEGRVNVSPKGMDTLRILNENRVVWLNLTGSGNETAAHLSENDRMTIMFCSFEEKPLILRLYGHAKIYLPNDNEYRKLSGHFMSHVGARQIIDLEVDLVQTSCGFAVPFMEFKSERSQLTTWSVKKGKDGIEDYWEKKNKVSLDGKAIKIE